MNAIETATAPNLEAVLVEACREVLAGNVADETVAPEPERAAVQRCEPVSPTRYTAVLILARRLREMPSKERETAFGRLVVLAGKGKTPAEIVEGIR